MSFAGDLKKLPLADVFQSIHQNQLSGALRIEASPGERLIAFDQGFMIGCVGPDGLGIGDELVRRGLVDERQVRSTTFFRRKGNLKKNLSRKKIMESGEFTSLARTVVLERVYDCFLLDEGKFEFVDDYDQKRFDPDELATGLRVQPGEILMEAMRRVDEWQRIKRSIPSLKEVYVATREADEDDPEVAQALLESADGQRGLDEILNSLPYNRFNLMETTLQLVSESAMRVATAPEYLELGQAAEQKGQYDLAASHYTRGLAYERGNEQLNQRLLAVLERSGQTQRAADERKRYAGVLLEQGQRKAACEQYREAARLVPSDPLPLERLLDLSVEGKDAEQAKDAAERLVEVYLHLGLGEKAKNVYPRLLVLEPRDAGLRERLAETHAQLNEGGAASRIYRELADEDIGSGRLDQATKRLRKAVELVPEDGEAKRLLHDLETGEHAERRRRRRRYVIDAVLAALFTLGVGWLSYEGLALTYLEDASQSALRTLASPDPRSPVETVLLYEEHAEAFPYTYAGRWARRQQGPLLSIFVTRLERAGLEDGLSPPPAEAADTDEYKANVAALKLALDPDDPPAWRRAALEALTALRLGDTAKAREAFQRAEEGFHDVRRRFDSLSSGQRRVAWTQPKDPKQGSKVDRRPAFAEARLLTTLAWAELTLAETECVEQLRQISKRLVPELGQAQGTGPPRPPPQATDEPATTPSPQPSNSERPRPSTSRRDELPPINDPR